MNSLGSKIQGLRKSAGFTQAKLAELTGMTQGMISAYEGDKVADVTLGSLRALGKALGVSVPDLLADETPVSAPPRAPTPDELTMAMLERFGVEKERLALIEAVLKAGKAELKTFIAAKNAIDGASSSSPGSASKKHSAS